jgi:hypothetical protein
MPYKQAATASDRRSSARSAPTSVVLLGGAGLILVGAGALLSWRVGPAVYVKDTVLLALAWCF